MPVSDFHSFQGTPVLILTVQIDSCRPILAGDPVSAILRDVWLHTALQDRWFVGAYWMLPDRVVLFASADDSACEIGCWVNRWQTEVSRRINRTADASPLLWGKEGAAVPMTSEADYQARVDALRAESSRWLDPFVASDRTGILWQLW